MMTEHIFYFLENSFYEENSLVKQTQFRNSKKKKVLEKKTKMTKKYLGLKLLEKFQKKSK
jgi:hypothetical protein